MNFQFFDLQDGSNPMNGAFVLDDKDVVNIFDLLKSRTPFAAELRAENGYSLQVGLGGQTGIAQYSDDGGSSWGAIERGAPPRMVALDEEYEDCLEFLCGDTATPSGARAGKADRSPDVLWEAN
jgi:hypothetical protein